MTEAERLAQRVEVVVKPHNNYGGAPAGTRLAVTRAEFQVNTRCLEEVAGPPAPAPRTAVVTVRADVAKMLGFPMGRRQDGPLVYEVTRLRPDGKEPLPTRQELEARSGGRDVMQLRVMDTPEVQEFARAVREEMDQLRNELARRQERIETHEAALRSAQADLAAAQQRIEEQAQANAAAVALCAAKDAELATLRAELEAAKAAPAPAPKGKAKE